ncbi:MAG: uridine diphosphate-N-acetylglucosamine-binding protein YvcK, partial [Chloroflexi bacterium]|nr:uridine diphosphate-N-acetylglucosamine-binding protein YvcK [Chloroflexota bacterium]
MDEIRGLFVAELTPGVRFPQRIAVLGGGTGQFNLLRGLVEHNQPELITAIPGTWDSGGSSGRLRTDLGVLPPGDARQCLIALIEDSDQRRVALRLFDDRLAEVNGPLQGHSLGNLIIARLDHIHQGQDRGLEAARKLLRIRASVTPVSPTRVELIARYQSGLEIEGEESIDHRWLRDDFDARDRPTRIYFSTKADPNPHALAALSGADKIVFSSGSLYGSVLPHLLVDGVQEVITASRAKVIFILNLMTEKGQTDHYRASDHLEALLFYLGDPHRLDYMVVNDAQLDREIVELYEREGQRPVEIDDDACLRLAPRLRIVRVPLARYLRREH